MSIFDHMYRLAEDTRKHNKEVQTKQDTDNVSREEEKEVAIQEKRSQHAMNVNPKTDNCSQELYNLISKYGFVIDSYEKHSDFEENDWYDRILETYYCHKGNWEFIIRNSSDVDISEGILALRDVKNTVTGEDLGHFYCDLGCRNTSEARRDELLAFLSKNSLQEYIDDAYSHYIALPGLLRERGYKVEEKDYSFGLNNPKGYLDMGQGVYVKVYHAWHDNLKVIVTNNNKWDVNSSNDSSDKLGYYFDYRSNSDIKELSRCLDAFRSHNLGLVGFFEDGVYYSNDDVTSFFDSLRDKNDYYKTAWNNYHIRVDHKQFWDGRGYAENPKTINKYLGLELYTVTELTFNNAAQWSVGDRCNTSIITFEYDRTKNVDLCRLQIANYIYSENESYQLYNGDDEDEYNHDHLTQSIELFGTFTELMERLEEYVLMMIDIHEVEL